MMGLHRHVFVAGMDFSKKTKCGLKIWKGLIDLPEATEITVLSLAMMEG